MKQILRLYSSSRTILLLSGELAVILGSFLLAILIAFQSQAGWVLWTSMWKVLGVAFLMLLCAYYMEMYDFEEPERSRETYTRILKLVGVVAFVLALIALTYPAFLVGRNAFFLALLIVTPFWMVWRTACERLILHPALREKVYLIGDGELARRVSNTIETRDELGMDLVGWEQYLGDPESGNEPLGRRLRDLAAKGEVERVVVALTDRRSTMPVKELLDLRLSGVVVEDATTLLENVSGKIEVDELRPSWLIFGEGFRLRPKHWLSRRIVSTLASLLLTLLTIPIVPLIALLIKLTSPGPVLYRQKRVGRRGKSFDCYKFRTMRCDAEADTGPTWASDSDPRITKFGRFLRLSRLDEIPQLWNVLKGDMAFVGPRPERPEFVNQLNQVIPFYNVRQATYPGITGWAQVSYRYGNTVEDAKEKLRYDLYYIKNCSVAFDLWIVFKTIRTVLFGRGAR